MKKVSLTLAVFLAITAVAAQAEIAVVAVGGDAAPDGNGKYFDFDIPTMNREGEVACVVTFGGTSGGNNDNTAIVRGTGVPGSLRLIVRRGAPSPDANGNFALLDSDSTPVINDAGEVAFIAGLSGTFGPNDATGVFRGDGTPGGLTPIVRQGQALPGIGTFPDFRGGGISQFSFDELGEVAFAVVGLGIYRTAGGPVTQIVRTGQPTPDGGTFAVAGVPSLNDSGQVAFSDFLSGIFRGDGSTIVRIANTGDPAPDGNGSLATSFSPAAAINNSGAVAFFSSLTGTHGGTSDNQGIFIGQDGALTTVVRRGQAAPDGNGRFLDLDSDVAINDAGQTAFLATLTATSGGPVDKTGVFRGDGTTLTQIVRTGDRAPDGSIINGVGKPALNDAGQVAFLGGLAANGQRPASHAIFLYDDQSGLRQMVRTGDALLGSTIAEGSNLIFAPSGTSNGPKRGSLNAQGQVVFRFDLNDGRRGIAVANPSTAPTECVGDCDASGDVTVNELIALVNIALGSADPSACSAGIPAATEVDIALIIRAVNLALTACPA